MNSMSPPPESSPRRTSPNRPLLVMFDIDGTLLLSKRAGARAMIEAARLLHGREIVVDGLEFAGRLDSQIWTDIATMNGIRDFDLRRAEFRSAYASILRELLASAPMAYALPGVIALINRLREEPGITLGLLTGNFAETGRLKISAAGLDPSHFPVSAWGDDGSDRRELPIVAMKRYREFTGAEIEPGRVVIVGDTPLDIDCARSNGCVSLAVATGVTHSLEQLRSCGPDLALPDLSRTDLILEWLKKR